MNSTYRRVNKKKKKNKFSSKSSKFSTSTYTRDRLIVEYLRYISDNYSSKTIEKNTLNCNCEDIWIQISDFNSNQIFYFGVIYRHPNSNIINFISSFNDKLIQLGKHKYYIVGDFNMNIDYKNRSVNSDMYLNMILSNGAFLPIDKC